jgi:P27 family predicted phage terminase small subunit
MWQCTISRMAPPTIPTEVKRRRGTLRKDRTPAVTGVVLTERAPLDVEPISPLEPEGRKAWFHFLATAVWIGRSDLYALKMLCEAIDRREAFAKELAGGTLMLETSTGYSYINPAAVGLKQTEEQIAKWMSVLGLTPSSRGALGVAEVKAASTLDKLASRRKTAAGAEVKQPAGARVALRAALPTARQRRAAENDGEGEPL